METRPAVNHVGATRAASAASSVIRVEPGISGEAHGLFGFFTPADKSAAENNGDDR